MSTRRPHVSLVSVVLLACLTATRGAPPIVDVKFALAKRYHQRQRLLVATGDELRAATRQGFNGERCKLEDYPRDRCVEPRLCMDFDVEPLDVCSTGSDRCFCHNLDDTLRYCACDRPCPVGEKCVSSFDAGTAAGVDGPMPGLNVCVSTALKAQSIECQVPLPINQGGFTFEPCNSDADCAQGRRCYRFVQQENILPCDGESGCECLPVDDDEAVCSCKYPDCVEGEVCTSLDNIILCSSAALNEPLVVCTVQTPPPNQPGTKLSWEPCDMSSECAGDRWCMTYSDNDDEIECDGHKDCTCQSTEKEDRLCSCLNPECPQGEICGFLPEDTRCLSTAVESMPLICDGKTIKPGKPLPEGSGATNYEFCSEQSDCAKNYECLDENYNECRGLKRCYCLTFDPFDSECSCDEPQCLKGDVCAFKSVYTYCHSAKLEVHPMTCDGVVFSPLPVTDAPDADVEAVDATPSAQMEIETQQSVEPEVVDSVCIDARALSHLQSHELLYEQHVLSNVLCDAFESCATQGHIVRYLGSTMMMKTYCDRVGCQQRVMHVNSPRYRKQLRVKSNTHGLQFTAFAARYATVAEEAVLAAAVRVGL